MGQWTPGRARKREVASTIPAVCTEVHAEPQDAPANVVMALKKRRPDRVDLRRRDRREWSETIGSRASFLLPEDRALVEAVFVEGLDAASAASRLGGSARTARRRARVLARRVLSREFEFVLRERDSWPRLRRLVATSCVLQGRTLRDAAAHLRVTLHTVRRQMDVVRTMIDEGGPR